MQTSQDKTFYSDAFTSGKYQKKTWTIMVYMNGDNSLHDYTYFDINELEGVDLEDEINIIVLWDRSGAYTKLLKIKYDPNNTSDIVSEYLTATIGGYNIVQNISNTEVNMLSASTLSDFVDFGKTNYPTDYYALILWGHADGYKSTVKGMDDDTDNGLSSGYLANDLIAQTLSTKNLTVVAFDACIQGTLETLWSFKKNGLTSLFIASPNLVPGTGWNYKKFLTRFKDSYRRPLDYTLTAVLSYQETYSQTSNVSLNVYDLNNLDISSSSQGSLQDFITWSNNSANKTAQKTLFTSDSIPTLDNSFKDFYEFIKQSSYPYKETLIASLNQVVIQGWRNGKTEYRSIGINSNQYLGGYSGIEFSADTEWNEFLQ